MSLFFEYYALQILFVFLCMGLINWKTKRELLFCLFIPLYWIFVYIKFTLGEINARNS